MFWHSRSRRGGAHLLCGLNTRHVKDIILCINRSSWQEHRIPRTKKMFFQAGISGAAGFSGVLIGTKSLFCFRSIGCQSESYAAHRTPPFSALWCKRQQQKTPRAQQYTSSLLIPCAHGKLNVKHHRATPKPEIHTSSTVEKDEAALARK